MKKYFYFVLFIVICAFGEALNFKASVGVNPYESVQLTLNYMTAIKVGTLSFVFNCIFIILQVLFTRKVEFKYILQIPMCLILSLTINLVVYIFLGHLELNYLMRFIFMILGLAISAFGVGLFMSLDLVVFPLEGFCQILADYIHFDFAKLRQIFDIIFIVISLVLALVFQLDFAVREGTIIGAIIYSPIMGLTMKKFSDKLKVEE